jgi:predicted MFS family arabinose efflux permease
LIRLRYQILAFSVTRMVMNTAHRMVYPFLPAFGRGLGVDLQALSLVMTLRGLAGAFGPFLASVADSRGRKAGMLFGLLLFSSGLTVVVFSPTYFGFLLALILATLGKYAFDPAMQAYIGDQVDYRQRGKVLAVTELGWSMSFILGMPFIAFLIARQGWLAPFPLLAVLGVFSLGLLYFWLPKDPKPVEERPTMLQNLRSTLTYGPALAGLSVGLLASAGNEVVNLVFGVWMENSFGLMIAALGGAAAIIGFSELGGEILSGGFTDRLGKIRSVGLGLFLNCLAALALPFLGRDVLGALLGLFLFYITFEFTLVSSIPLMTEILPKSRATLMAANVAGLSIGRALGAFLSPILYIPGSDPSIFGSVFATVVLNLLALSALILLRRGMKTL